LLCQIKHGRQPVVKLIDLGMSLMYDPKKPVTGVRQLIILGFKSVAPAYQDRMRHGSLASTTWQTVTV
jgi:hypothetical protein